MNDSIIIDTFFKNGKINSYRTRLSWLEKNIDVYNYLKLRYSDSKSIPETIWRIYLHLEDRPVCPVCGKEVQYLRLGKFSTCCSNSCGSKYAQDKVKETSLKKYGVEHYSKTQESKDRHKITCLEKYGVDSYSKTNEYKEKIKETSLEKYGETNYAKTQEAKEKCKNTCLEKYGTSCYSKSDEYKEKCLETNNKKYGVNYFFQSKEFKDKSSKTNLEKYNSSKYCQCEDFKKKTKKTIKEKYGFDYYVESEEFKDKAKETNLEKYGKELYSKSEFFKNLYKDKEWVDTWLKKSNETKRKNKSFNKSKLEDELYEKILSIYPDTVRQYRSEKYPFNCDFYIPSLDLYIEYNGLWTHGYHPFDENNLEDINILTIWKEKSKYSKFYENAIKVWTVSDPLKRKIAKENNLNYIEIF